MPLFSDNSHKLQILTASPIEAKYHVCIQKSRQALHFSPKVSSMSRRRKIVDNVQFVHKVIKQMIEENACNWKICRHYSVYQIKS